MLSLSLFHDFYSIKGGGTPVVDQAGGARNLTLLGSGTAPRASSYKRRRGAEFRTSGFSATAPRAFATVGSGGNLHTSLYVASKIQSFTYCDWVRPQKTGISAVGLAVVGGVFSAANVGATPWIYNQPCLVLMDAVAGSGFVVVSCFGTLLDTRTATQTVGPVSTIPLADGDYSFVAVRVTGSTTVNNQVDAVALYTRSIDGVVRVYTLGEHKASARFSIGSTNPSNNNTVSIGGRARTFKTTLSGSIAGGLIANGGSAQPADGETLVVGSKTYTFKNSVTASAKASAIISILNVDCTASTPTITLTIGGYAIRIGFGTKNARGQAAGYLQGNKGGNAASDREDNAATLHGAIHGDFDDNDTVFIKPAPPTSGVNSGKDWSLAAVSCRNFSTKLTSYVAGSFQVIVEALVAGSDGNAITLTLTDTTPVVTIPSATLTGGTAAPTAYSVKIGANWAATKANLIAAINAAAGAGSTYSADITTANPEASASDPGGTSITLTSKKTGTAGNGTTLTQSAATFVLTAFSGGGTGVDDEVLIGASAQASWQNMADAINQTGATGIAYGTDGSLPVDAFVAATMTTGYLTVRSIESGTTGNSRALATTVTGVVIQDEFGDKTLTTMTGGQAAPPFTVPSGARPDQSDLRLVVGGLPAL